MINRDIVDLTENEYVNRWLLDTNILSKMHFQYIIISLQNVNNEKKLGLYMGN